MPTQSAIERANRIAAQYSGKAQTTAGANSSRPSAIPNTQSRTAQAAAPVTQPITQSSTPRAATQTALARAEAIYARYGERAAAARQQPVTNHSLQSSGAIDRGLTGTGSNTAAGTSRYLNSVYDKADSRASSLPGSSYAEILTRPDYAANSAAGDSKVRWGFGSDTRYDYINDIDGRREKEDYAMVRAMGNGELGKYAFMTQDEIGVYNYLYATQGKQAANAFLEELEPELNRQWYSGASANAQELANENAATKALYSGLTVLGQPARSLSSMLAAGQDLMNTITGRGIDPYSKLRQPSLLTQDVREGISEGMGKVESFLYNTGMSAGDSAMNYLASRGLGKVFGLTGDALMKATNIIGSALMSSEVASTSVTESKNKGYSDAGALSLGLIRGGIEYLSEAIGGEWVIKNVKSNPLNLFSTMLLGMIPEGMEEVMSDAGNEAANIIIDLLFNTDESYIANSLQYFTEQGDKDPVGSTLKAIVQHELLSFLGGAFATVGSSGVQYGTNRAAINQSAEQLHTTPETVVTLMQELDTDNPQLIGWLAEMHDAENAEDFRKKVGEAKNAEEAIDAAMKVKGSRSAFDENVTDAELTQLRDLAGQALNTLNLDEQTRAQLRVLQTAADAELRDRGANHKNAAHDNGSGQRAAEGVGPYANNTANNANNTANNANNITGSGAAVNMTGGENHVQAEAETEGVLGQAQTVPPTGEEAGRGGAPDAAAAGSTTGIETAQSGGAGAAVSDGGERRDAGVGLGGESERVVRSAEERRERAAEQGRRASARQSLGTALWERGEVNLQSAQELGITNGSETQDLKVFPQEHYDEEMQDVADWVASEYGLPVTFVSGIIHVADGSGNLYRVRGVYTGNGIILQADNRNESITSLARHEVFHDEAARDAGLVDAIRDEITRIYGREEMERILRGYLLNLRGETKVDENTSPERIEEVSLQVFEEICADAAGGINAFGLGAYQYENTVNRVRQERAALREQANGERETRGPPEDKFSFAGERADGIEVYETSPEVKALRWGERRRRFMDLMENQYRGRTAKFTVDGETYYARFAKEDVKKNIYGDLNSDRPGKDAKINAGADGDIFDLVENARYDHSEDERGKTSKAHRGIESWDYFVKKVQIDGKVFDLLANVRKSSDAEYVYSLQINEDKSAEAAPPNRLANDQSLTRALTASTDSITEESENSNTRFSMDDSEIPGAIWGDEDETFVNDTEPVKFRWAIVPLESLVVSNDTSGSVNPAYPAELQPRNRGRQASQLQMEKISRNINPRQLEDSPNAQNGAPIIRSDGVVIGGNIRSMALTDAYAKGRADAYRDYVASRAARKFGLDTSELPEHPVLVRVAEDVSDWAKLARDLNTSTVAAYSATERAMADAARMDSRIMAMLSPDEDGNINSAANRDFIQSFVSNVIPDNERGAAITGSGLLSQDGLERAEYAIFAAAYQDAELMQRMSESLDNDMKNVTNGLLDIAPRVVQVEADADAGTSYDVGVRKRILDAVELYTGAKRAGKSVEEYTANHSLTEDWSNETIYVARYIEKNKRSAKQIRSFFNGLFDEIESYGDPNQLNLFGEQEEHSYREALEGAIRRYEQATGTELPRLSEWGAGEFEAVERGSAQSETHDAVSDGGDPGLREDSGGRQLLDGGRDADTESVEPEIPEDTGLHLPPPPGEETAKKEKRPARKDLVDYVETYVAPYSGRGSYTPSIPEGTSIDEYAKAAQARAEAAKQERLRNIPKGEFTGTKHLQDLGVKVENSVGIYRFIDSMIANHRAAKAFRRELERTERRLRPTAAEKEFAAGIAAGTYTAEDIPAKMDRAAVEELADYYFAERGISNDLIGKQRKAINQALDEKMESLFPDSADDSYKPTSAVVLNNRTPERNMRKIFGDKLGDEINKTIFYPVQANEAERIRFINRMHEEVRKFKGSDGKTKALNKEERALVQMMIEGKAAQEEVASAEMRAAIESAGQNIHRAMSGIKGELEQAKAAQAAAVDAAREFSLSASDAQLAQRYARWLEAQKLLESEKVDSVRVNNAVKKYSEMFGQFYDAINDFLVAHGYEPIGFIRGYAPHMQPEENQTLLNKAFQAMGINTDVSRLPSSIAGLTADYKPNKRWNPYFLQRVGDITEYDIASAYESYVDYMSDVLYHTDDIMRIRAMSRYFRRTYAPENIHENLETAFHMRYASQEDKTDFLRGHDVLSRESALTLADTDKMLNDYVDKLLEEAGKTTKYSDLVMWIDNYANTLAGKQSMIDRGWEAGWGRKVLNVGNKLTRAFATAQVAGNLSSVLNQTAQLSQIQAELGTKYVAAALRDNWRGQMRRSSWAQDSDFLTGKNGIDYLVTDWQDMIVSNLFKPADFMDGFMATLAVRGRYLKEIDAGKSHAEAMKTADQFGREVMGSRMKGARPTAYDAKNPVSQMLHIFQIEAVNSWEHLTQDVMGRDFRTIAEAKGKKAATAAVAGVIVKMLLSAFFLNRLDEELYGGTPAPFDIFGLFANFVASGEGLTTDQWLKTVMDNGWEKLTGERLFDTDADATQGDFDLEEALKDTGYNISNDIPFLRNFAALMGWGDNSLPIPDIYGTLKDVSSSALENGLFSRQTGKALLGGAAEWLPAGRQITKTAHGYQVMDQGGYVVNGKLYYPVENSLGNWIKALMFGRSALSEAAAFYAGNDTKLSEKQTEMYRELTESGADRFEVYRAVQDYRNISGNKDLGSYEKGRQERELIKGLDLNDQQKLTFYQVMTGTEARTDKLASMMQAGLSFNEALDAYDAYARYNADEGMSNTEKANAFAAWVDRQDYTVEEKSAVRENLKYYNNVPITQTGVDMFTGAGMETDAAEQLSETLQDLKPLPGNDQVTALQKYEAISDSGLSVEDQWKAMVAQTPASYTSYLQKFEIFQQQDISPAVWVQFRQASLSADNGDGNISGAEAEAALDGMNIPTWQKAILWQTQNKQFGRNSNPYDREIGQAVYDQMHGGTQTSTSAHNGLTLGSWGATGSSAPAKDNGTAAHNGLTLGSWG